MDRYLTIISILLWILAIVFHFASTALAPSWLIIAAGLLLAIGVLTGK